MIKFVDLQGQYQKIKKEIEKEVLEVLASGRYSAGLKTEAFEKKFAEFCRTKYALAVNNGSSALLLALLALNLKKGSEVITQPNTFVATVAAIIFAGLKPVFCDINPETYNLDAKKIEKVITKKTKVILPVHLFGQTADMGAILKIARKYKLFVVEDCAQAHGAEYHKKRAGSFGDIGCFSFYPTKVLGACGEGGAVVVNNQELVEKMKRLRDHGSAKKYYHSEVGFNFRLEEIQGAILGVKMKYLGQWIKSRQKAARIYDKLLKNSGVATPFAPKGFKGVYYVYVVRAKNRNELQEYLAKSGIGTMIHYPLPIHLQEGYKFLGYKTGDFPEAEKAADEILSLPFYPEIKLSEQKLVAQKIKEFYAGYAK
ncbi:MAG: DegT/DnrJ/EryC1/StrS family aminotransferase [bacterium]